MLASSSREGAQDSLRGGSWAQEGRTCSATRRRLLLGEGRIEAIAGAGLGPRRETSFDQSVRAFEVQPEILQAQARVDDPDARPPQGGRQVAPCVRLRARCWCTSRSGCASDTAVTDRTPVCSLSDTTRRRRIRGAPARADGRRAPALPLGGLRPGRLLPPATGQPGQGPLPRSQPGPGNRKPQRSGPAHAPGPSSRDGPLCSGVRGVCARCSAFQLMIRPAWSGASTLAY